MAAGVEIVKAGISVTLLRRYKLRYDEELAARLAAAVSNELFSDPPSNPRGSAFLTDNRELIRQEIEALQEDYEIRGELTQALRVKAMVSFAEGNRDREHLIEPVEKLRKLGLLIGGGELLSPDTFFPLVRRYYRLIKLKPGQLNGGDG